jgi:hypothetical protein
MTSKCVHCFNPNPENWFYCKECGRRSSESRYSTNMWMRTERGKRTDVEINTISMDESVKQMNARH